MTQLAYNVFPEGCILITDGLFLPRCAVHLSSGNTAATAMKILDPHLKDGVHEWRDGKRLVKEGFKLYLEGTDTLAGRCVARISDTIRSNLLGRLSVVTLDACVRNFSRFTGCSLGEAIKCVTFNPARCLGIENRKGTLRPDADADLVILNRSGNVLSTWVTGKEVWKNSISCTW